MVDAADSTINRSAGERTHFLPAQSSESAQGCKWAQGIEDLSYGHLSFKPQVKEPRVLARAKLERGNRVAQ